MGNVSMLKSRASLIRVAECEGDLDLNCRSDPSFHAAVLVMEHRGSLEASNR